MNIIEIIGLVSAILGIIAFILDRSKVFSLIVLVLFGLFMFYLGSFFSKGSFDYSTLSNKDLVKLAYKKTYKSDGILGDDEDILIDQSNAKFAECELFHNQARRLVPSKYCSVRIVYKEIISKLISKEHGDKLVVIFDIYEGTVGGGIQDFAYEIVLIDVNSMGKIEIEARKIIDLHHKVHLVPEKFQIKTLDKTLLFFLETYFSQKTSQAKDLFVMSLKEDVFELVPFHTRTPLFQRDYDKRPEHDPKLQYEEIPLLNFYGIYSSYQEEDCFFKSRYEFYDNRLNFYFEHNYDNPGYCLDREYIRKYRPQNNSMHKFKFENNRFIEIQ